jgi:hypothetical protein
MNRFDWTKPVTVTRGEFNEAFRELSNNSQEGPTVEKLKSLGIVFKYVDLNDQRVWGCGELSERLVSGSRRLLDNQTK